MSNGERFVKKELDNLSFRLCVLKDDLAAIQWRLEDLIKSPYADRIDLESWVEFKELLRGGVDLSSLALEVSALIEKRALKKEV